MNNLGQCQSTSIASAAVITFPAPRRSMQLSSAFKFYAMLLQIPDVLTPEQLATARGLVDARRVDRRPRDRRPSVGEGEGQPADSRRASRGARSRRDDPSGAQSQSAVHLRGAAADRSFRRSSTATTRASRSATTSTTPSGRFPARRIASARICRQRLFLTDPTDYDGGELVSRRHLRRAQREAARRAHGAVSVDQPAPRAAR